MEHSQSDSTFSLCRIATKSFPVTQSGLHCQNITAEEVQIGLSLFKQLQGQVPCDLSASSVNIKEVLSTLSAVKIIGLW